MAGKRKKKSKSTPPGIVKKLFPLFVLFTAAIITSFLFKSEEKQAVNENIPCQTVDEWTTLDDYQYSAEMQSTANTSGIDNKGNLYVAGLGFTKRGTRWIVRKSATGERGSWEVVDDYVSEKTVFGGVPKGIGSDFQGKLYVAGSESLSYPDKKKYRHHWIVRMSPDGSPGSWETVDSYSHGETGNALAKGVVGDVSGNIYVVGGGYENFGDSDWIVRKGSSYSKGYWKTVDEYRFKGKSSEALGITIDPFGNLYTIGRSTGTWLVRKSEDKGESWKLVDSYQYIAGKASYPSAIAANSYGQLFVAGQGTDEKDKYHWIVRKSEDFGVTWQTVDDYQYRKGHFSYANGIIIDGQGRIYVGGSGRTANYQNPWIVRASYDGGKSWNVFDEFKYNADNSEDKVIDDVVVAMGLDSRGHPLALGDVYGSPSRRWIVRGFPCR